MSSLTFGGEYSSGESDAQVWRAIIISLGLHALVAVMYPHLSHMELPKLPDRLEIEFLSVKMPEPASAPSMQQTTQPTETTPLKPLKSIAKPQLTKPVETSKPVLSSQSNDAGYRVSEQSAPTKVEPAPATQAIQTTPSTPTVTSESPSRAANDASNKESKQTTTTNTQASSESEELTASDNDAWGDYGDQLRTLVNKGKQYPAIAIRRHLEGEVTVVAQFVRGELTQISLAESSKHAPLDEEALRMVKKAIGQLAMKESLKKKTFKIIVPVQFKLE